MIEVATTEQVPMGAATCVSTPTADVVIFNLGGRLFALENVCLRCGSSLASGSLHDGQVTCRHCRWTYDIATGRVSGLPSLCTDSFAVQIVGSRVLLDENPLVHSR